MSRRASALVGRLVLAVLAGAGLWASFPDLSWWWLTVPSVALLVAATDRLPAGRAAVVGLVAGFTFWLPHIEWVRLSTGGTLPLVALAGIQAFFWAVWAWVTRLARVWAWTRTPWGQAGLTALTWVGVEQVRSHAPWSGFPWANLALPQVDSPLGHLAPLGGEVLVSALVVLVAVLVRRAFSFVRGGEDRHWWYRPVLLTCALSVFLAPGLVPLSQSQQARAVRVGVVQGNVEIPGARTYAEEGHVTGNNRDVSLELAESGESVDLVVWGEGAADRDPRVSRVVAERVRESVEALGVPVLVGFNEYVKDRDVIHNLVVPWYPGEGLAMDAAYGKQIPVPFGEYIPWRRFVSSLATETAQVRVDMEGMDGPGLMEVRLGDGRTLPMALGICFEVAYESVIGEGVREGGELIVIPSNNYHFRTSAESAQQVQMLRFRAMEFSRSALQASTTGESALVRPDGSVQALSGRQTAEFLTGELPLRDGWTPALWVAPVLRVGAMLTVAAVAVLACVVRVGRGLRARSRRRASVGARGR